MDRQRKVTSSTYKFDYSGLSTAITKQLQAAVPRIRAAVEQERAAVIGIGKELLSAKAILKARTEAFVPWVTKECGLNPRSANRYMATARMFGDKAEEAVHTPAQVLYGLSQAKTLPPKCRVLVTQIKRGKVVSLAEYRAAAGMKRANKSVSGSKPGSATREWWDSRPAALTVTRHITEKEFARYTQSVIAIYNRQRKAA